MSVMSLRLNRGELDKIEKLSKLHKEHRSR